MRPKLSKQISSVNSDEKSEILKVKKFPRFEPEAEAGRHGEPGGDGGGRRGDEGARRGLGDPHQPRPDKIGVLSQITFFRQNNYN